MRLRYVIYGAGGIGGGIGAQLFLHGHDVTLIARGAHLEKIRRDGLRLRTPEADRTLSLPAVGSPHEIRFGPEHVVVFCMKSQDTEAAARDLCAAAGASVPVVMGQNGVENERIAARRFTSVYGMLVYMPATFLEPGEVLVHATKSLGVLDSGVYPEGVDERITQLCRDLQGSGFTARADPHIMRWKYAKLVTNLRNAVVALCGPKADTKAITDSARAEAFACLDASGVDYLRPRDLHARTADAIEMADIAGGRRGAGSTWQSLARETGSSEVDFLNGEISLLGRLHGIATPYNQALQTLVNEAARSGRGPGSYAPEDIVGRAAALA